LSLLDERRRFSLMLDYEFGRGTSRALPRAGLEYLYSRRSGRLRQVMQEGKLFAVIRPNGAIALSLHGARAMAASRAFLENSVTVSEEAERFVRAGKSVFCKFVAKVGRHVPPGGEVVVLGADGRVIAVGRAKLPGVYMIGFKAGVAVKVRSAHEWR
jgi:archaeosine-15-forming tRNA-guanine transglycosylase